MRAAVSAGRMGPMGRVFFILAALAAPGCAAMQGPTVAQSLRSAEVSLKGVDVRLAADAEEWDALAEQAFARCSSITLTADRETCLGTMAQGRRAAELAAELSADYDGLAELLVKARKAADELEALHAAAKAEAQ